ncbi:MAG: tetratricopeptide repeat protein, partial [Bacteroidales bacterium]|nr:tetratricopeptide repeat protein [Bacteroidales bacterium]
EDKQYNVLIKIYRDGEYEFPLLEDGWRNFNSAKFWVFPANNLIKVFPEDIEFEEAFATNLDVYCYGEIKDYNPYTLNDKIVNRINRTIDATYVNAANLVIAVWPLRDNDTEVIRFKIIETYNKKTLTGYYLEPSNIKKLFSNSYYQVFYYEFKNFIRDATIYNIPVESTPSEYMSYYRWGVLKYQSGNYDGAVQDFDKAVEINPETKDFMLYSYRGNAKTKLRDFNGAIEDFDRALDIEPTEVVDYSNWVRNYYNRGVAKFYVNDINGACRDWHNAYELGFGLALEYLNKYCQ